MIEYLRNLDTKCFLFINSNHCSFCDFIFYWASDKFIWIPFYFFLAAFLLIKFGREIWKILLSVTVLIFLSDQLSVLIKECVMRFRPCHNLILQNQIHLVNEKCGGLYSFVSSHAANSFAIAAFVILVINKKPKWMAALLISWCLLVSYSRVYLGVHYPLDIIGGWIVGFIIALGIFYFYRKLFCHVKN